MTPKFRAWLKSEKKMVDVEGLEFVGGKLYNIRCKMNGLMSFCLAHFVLMQSTGVFDCNGEEIYEGDVLFRGERHKGDKSYKGEVIFWQFGERGNSIYTTTEKMVVNSFAHNLVMIEEADRLQILGNIYENPELLEEAD